jgi:hypothetical protein
MVAPPRGELGRRAAGEGDRNVAAFVVAETINPAMFSRTRGAVKSTI